MLFIKTNTKIFTVWFAVATMVLATESGARPDRGGPHGPPPEAIESSANLTEGDACSFTGRRNDTVEGTCIVLTSGDEELACAPEGGPPDHGGRPE